ncbi:hypothetical protein Tdes44962_MAKER03755 [Teratosphaeria destructans]|uniref:Uncharacterized protein n=1 Tax=Teratosphaeria destructans TaxID=418781 RepID=A0A9W7W0S4_9PEZI|nr:hypothetical protein Tdes44962_MAKER03755 [Teratosphaeria destructans]
MGTQGHTLVVDDGGGEQGEEEVEEADTVEHAAHEAGLRRGDAGRDALGEEGARGIERLHDRRRHAAVHNDSSARSAGTVSTARR